MLQPDKLWSLLYESYPTWNFGLAKKDILTLSKELDETEIIWFSPRKKLLVAADPFLYEYDNQTYVFYEEVSKKRALGSIAFCTFDGNSFSEPQTLHLENSNTHYSYPFVFYWNNSHYLLTENYVSGRLILYRATEFPHGWEATATLLEEPVVDPTLVFYKEKFWLFYTKQGNDREHTDLYLSYADAPEGPWIPHPQNPVKKDNTSARPAGKLFEQNGVLYRPAQNCTIAYGHHVVLNEVTELSETSFNERKAALVGPLFAQPYSQGLHTVNSNGKYTVIDARRIVTETRSFGKILQIIRRKFAGTDEEEKLLNRATKVAAMLSLAGEQGTFF